jgi:hypothetical protein
VTAKTRERRREAALEVEAIVDEEFDRLVDQYKRQRADAVISTMYESAERLKAAELERTLDDLDLDEDEAAVVESMADAIVSQLLAAPTSSLRDAAEEDDWATINTALQLFDPEFGSGVTHGILAYQSHITVAANSTRPIAAGSGNVTNLFGVKRGGILNQQASGNEGTGTVDRVYRLTEPGTFIFDETNISANIQRVSGAAGIVYNRSQKKMYGISAFRPGSNKQYFELDMNTTSVPSQPDNGLRFYWDTDEGAGNMLRYIDEFGNDYQIDVFDYTNTFTPSNVTTTRSFDADNTTVAELADVVGTLIQDKGLDGNAI